MAFQRSRTMKDSGVAGPLSHDAIVTLCKNLSNSVRINP